MPRARRTTPILRLKLDGPGIKRGRIAVPDLIEVCRQAQSAVSRQAQAIEGHRTLRPGPIISKVQAECTLELLRIGPGSTTLDFGIEKPQLPLPFDELKTYSTDAIRELADTIDHFERGENGKKSLDRGVLDSLSKLGTVFDRKKVSRIEWIIPGRGRRKRRTVVFNPMVRKKVEKVMSSLPHRVSTDVEGLLEMADFRPEDRKCRIDPPLGRAIVCTFDKSIEEIVYSVLRQPVRASGMGEFNAETQELDVLHIVKLEPIETVLLGAGDFESGKSLEELIRSQGVKPLRTIKQLEGGLSADEPLDELIEEIYATRV